MMKEQQKYHLQKEKKRSSEWHSNVSSSSFSAWLGPCKPYADAFLLCHQTKSEMQVEFYVSDIQEVRNRLVLRSNLRRFPAHCTTFKQPGCTQHKSRPLRICLPFSLSLSSSRSFLLSHM